MRYRVLSLDLHDTVVWDTLAIVEARSKVRLNLLAEGLRMSNGSQVPLEELRRAREALYLGMAEGGTSRGVRPRGRPGGPDASTPGSSVLRAPSSRSSNATPKGG